VLGLYVLVEVRHEHFAHRADKLHFIPPNTALEEGTVVNDVLLVAEVRGRTCTLYPGDKEKHLA
jgi:hypothetical protein